ncbi:peptidoglycan binding protein, partial [Listeria ivanovii FSL F6-596]
MDFLISYQNTETSEEVNNYTASYNMSDLILASEPNNEQEPSNQKDTTNQDQDIKK